MTHLVARLIPLTLGLACTGCNNARSLSAVHEVGRFRPPNMHALYPSVTHFVVAPEAIVSNERTLLAYARRSCAGDDEVCLVLFWTEASKAARSFPIADGEASAMVASYRRNRVTGAEGFQCYNFALRERHCAMR